MADPQDLLPPATMTSEMVMRSVVTSLKNCMKELGLVPSRVYPSIPSPGPLDNGQRQEKYPNVQIFNSVLELERKGEMELAVLSFVDMLLADEAPTSIMASFMQGLFKANSDLEHPNPALWLIYDIITLASAYYPLQELLFSYVVQGQNESESRKVNLEDVLTQLDGQGLLKPEHVPLVLDAADQPVAAATRLLAFVYAARVDKLKNDYYNRCVEEQMTAGAILEPDVRDAHQMDWLKALVETIERNGGTGFKMALPQSLFCVETWAAVYDHLAYGGHGRALRDIDDSASETASDTTIIEEDDSNFDEGANGDLTLRVVDNIQPTRIKLQKFHEGHNFNQEYQFRQQRTASFVLNSSPNARITEIYDHMYEVAANSIPIDTDDTSSVSSMRSRFSDTSTGTTDNNCSIELSILTPIQLQTSNNLRGSRQSRSAVIAEGQIKLREYQEELLRWVREGKNVAIFLPTGTGKTFIIMKYVQEHLAKPGLNRIMFLAPKVKLAEQQYHRFRDFFPKVTYFRCGKSKSSQAPFSELLDTFKVFVLTPQCLVEAIERKEVKMTDFSLLVLDECHHINLGKHAYAVLMNCYMDAKFDHDASPGSFPQVIGLTASPGVGTGGTLLSARNYIQDLCFAMDVERICTVKEHKTELEQYVSEPRHEIHTCLKRKKDGFKKIIEQLMKTIEGSMLDGPFVEMFWTQEQKLRLEKILTAPDLHRGKLLYYQWLTSLETKLVDFAEFKATYQKLFSMTEMLIVYQKCLTLNEDCQSQYALEFVQEQARKLEDQVPRGQLQSIERQLLDDFYRRVPDLQRASDDPEDFNPKLVMLEDILLTIVEQNQDDCACMVFVRTLELTRALQRWVQEHPDLGFLNPGRLTGNHRHDVGGMSRSEMSDVVAKFNNGDHKLLVCTSAAEEGLDFQACNVVVRYDYVTSMISMIQTRGRARRMDSQYCVVGTVAQGNGTKEMQNMAAENLMKNAIGELQELMEANQNSYFDNMRRWQKRAWEDRKRAKLCALEKRRIRITSATPYQLLCRKCQEPACMSTDFRLLEQSNRAVVSESFNGKWKRVATKEPVKFKETIEKVAKVHCQKCSYDWGILARYIPTNRLLPVLKVESFFLVDTRNNEKLLEKFKWSKVPFEVPDITNEELL